jgi:hypothetical protein
MQEVEIVHRDKVIGLEKSDEAKIFTIAKAMRV